MGIGERKIGTPEQAGSVGKKKKDGLGTKLGPTA